MAARSSNLQARQGGRGGWPGACACEPRRPPQPVLLLAPGTHRTRRTARWPGAGRRARLKAWCGVLWRRAKAEFWLEVPLLQARWLVTLLCLVFQ